MKLVIPRENYDGLVEFYDAVAMEIGYADTSKLHYDCRNINIAKNIQDGFYAYYREANPELEESEVDVQVTALLLLSGPKVDKNLNANEVEIFDGFIC